MNKIFLFFSLIVFVKCGSTEEDGPKRNSLAILKEAPFIRVELNVRPVSSDSIMVKTTITNDQDKELAIYKPYVPSDTSRLSLFSILEKNSYDPLDFRKPKF